MAPSWAAAAPTAAWPITFYFLSSAPSTQFPARGRSAGLSSWKRTDGFGFAAARPRHRGLQSGRERFSTAEAAASAASGGVSDDSVSGMSEKAGEGSKDEVSRATLLWRAVKLPIYSVALVPLTVGTSAAYLHSGIFSSSRYFLLLSASVLIIAWLNLSNDVYDFDTGADWNKSESVVNIIGSRVITHSLANLCLVLGSIGLIWTCAQSGDIRSTLLLALAIICGYIYQCPPFRLGYRGLGEPLCFAAFGPFATTAFYFSQGCKDLSWTVFSASILVGFTTSLILFCSHFHQIEGDQAIGKLSPLVRVGTARGAEVVKVAILMLYLLLLTFCTAKFLPIPCMVLCALTLPVGKLVAEYVEKNHEDKVKIFMAKYYCVRLHSLFGVSLALGLVLARTWANSGFPGISAT